MRRPLMLAAAMMTVAACWSEPEESTTARELLEDEDSVIRAGTVAPDSVTLRTGDSVAIRDSAALRDSAPPQDTGVRPRGAPRS